MLIIVQMFFTINTRDAVTQMNEAAKFSATLTSDLANGTQCHDELQ
jgi:hypothetical protein